MVEEGKSPPFADDYVDLVVVVAVLLFPAVDSYSQVRAYQKSVHFAITRAGHGAMCNSARASLPANERRR